MAWYNNLGDLAGDIGSIAHGRNPTNNAPPKNIPATGGVGLPTIPGLPNSGQTISANSGDPSGDPSDASSSYYDDPSNPTGSTGDSSSFDLSGLLGALKTGGSAVAAWVAAHPKDVLNIVGQYSQYQRQKAGDTYAKDGLALATAEYNDPTGKAALRTAGTAGMLNPKANTPDLSNLQTLAGPKSGNPFTQGLPLAPLNHPATTATTPGSTPGSTPGGWMGGIGQVVGKTVPPPLTGLPLGTTLPQGPNGPPPTIPSGMKPPPGWTPPKALPLADPNAPKVA